MYHLGTLALGTFGFAGLIFGGCIVATIIDKIKERKGDAHL